MCHQCGNLSLYGSKLDVALIIDRVTVETMPNVDKCVIGTFEAIFKMITNSNGTSFLENQNKFLDLILVSMNLNL
jgi:hypothetical protein